MSHLVGIDKGPVMDWTNDSGLDEWYRKWKKHVEVLFKGPLNAVLESIKCNYVVYWSGDHRMDLVLCMGCHPHTRVNPACIMERK